MQLAPIYRAITTVTIGDGSSVLFWKDHCLFPSMADEFPRLYSYARDEDVSVQGLLTAASIGASFHLPLSAQAMEELRDMQVAAADVTMTLGSRDSWDTIWQGGRFTSSKYYMHCFREEESDAAFKWVWRSSCTNKWKVFCWLLLSDRLNTRNMLRRRGMVLQHNDYGCLFCTNPPEETIEHLFFTCPFSRQCWDLLGVSWPLLGSRIEIIHEGQRLWDKPMFMEVFVVGAWSLWKERNNKHFRGVEPTVGSWLQRFKADFDLLRHRNKENLGHFITAFLLPL